MLSVLQQSNRRVGTFTFFGFFAADKSQQDSNFFDDLVLAHSFQDDVGPAEAAVRQIRHRRVSFFAENAAGYARPE